MSKDTPKAQVEAASGYESLLVPALFKEWTEVVLDTGQIGQGDHVLDLGCGTGILARDVLRRVGATGVVAGVPDPRTVALAERLAPHHFSHQ